MAHPNSERLQLYVEQRVGEWEREALAQHVAGCELCAEHVRNMQELVRNLESMKELSLPENFAADIAEEAAPSARLRVAPARRSVMLQAIVCLIILITCGGLLLVVDTPVTDPSDDVLGAIDMLLGSPFQADASIVAVLAIMALAGLGILACVLGSSPRAEAQRRAVTSRIRRRR
ncbi:MAG TPA: hypothetical protein VK009_24590 [Chloroflexota bacterium]|nr:hypothetical protein [Chloroflexota bacterium]